MAALRFRNLNKGGGVAIEKQIRLSFLTLDFYLFFSNPDMKILFFSFKTSFIPVMSTYLETNKTSKVPTTTVPMTSQYLLQNNLLKSIWFYLVAFSCFVLTSRDLKRMCLSTRYI